MNKPISWWHLTSIGLALLVVPAGGLADAADSKAAPLPLSSEVESGRFLGPVDVVASRDGQMLFVAAADARQILAVKAERGTTERVIDMPARPTGLVLSTDGRLLFVTCAAPEGTVAVVDVAAGTIREEIAVGHWPVAPAISPDGSRLYVCNRFDNNVEVIDTKTMKSGVRIPVTREPVAITVTPDGNSAFVINHLPNERANTGDVAAVVTVIDTASQETKTIRMPDGSTVMRGICVSPDGRYVFATHLLARYQMPTTQVERGWMNTNALSVIDAQRKELINTVLLDDIDLGAGDPWGVAATADGKTICVTHAGTHELSVIDAACLLDRLLALPTELPAGVDRKNHPWLAADVPNDLTFLAGLRRRIRLDADAPTGRPARSSNVNGPRGLTVVGSRVYVAAHFTDNLAIVDLEIGPEESKRSGSVRTISLGRMPGMSVERRGQMLFHDATLCFQQWQSCASCHPNARMDALNWDLINNVLGNPKNARSLLLAHQTPPSMSLGLLTDAGGRCE